MSLLDITTDNTNIIEKLPKTYYCIVCNYNTIDKRDYNKHLNTQKHNNMLNVSHKEVIKKQTKVYECNCGRIYKHSSSLCKHKKTCNKIDIESENILKEVEEEKIEESNTDLVIVEKQNPPQLEHNMVFDFVKQIAESNEMVLKTQITETSKQNIELQKEMFTQIIELLKTNLSTTNNINNGQIQNNTNNYTHFNLQIYLNETCKNAMTINQFLDYLEPTIEELEATAHLGYVEGISRIIMRGFKNLEEHELPFHCTDLKREHIYLKNPDDEWVEEKDEKPLLLRFIKEVARKSFKNLSAWQKQNPNWANYHSKQNDLFNKIVGNSMSGATEEEQQANYEKIMKNIMKNIVIDKSKKNC